MLKKIGLLLLILGLCGLFAATYFIPDSYKLELFVSIFISLAFIFLGFSFLAIQAKTVTQRKLKTAFLVIAIALMALCILSGFNKWPGTNMEGVLAIFIYCFAYAPIELYHKNIKWRAYTNDRLEIVLLSSIDFVGINLILIGVLTRALHWPGQYYLIYTGAGLLLVGLFIWNAKFKQEIVRRKASEDKIKIQYEEIEKEKQISENLLLNILPSEVAEELKAKGSAEAKQFDQVTVLFTDFKDFTKLSEKMTAKELVEEINTCFKAFDNIMEIHGIEKIKTIGDSYMCAGGLPVANETHAEDVVHAGLEIQKFVLNRMIERSAVGKAPFQIRIGIHTGSVVAGIVGIKKFAYDIWGDTVNTASRMESSGEAGKINMSGATYQLVKDKFMCTHRGKIHAKGKGEMDMYFVDGLV